MAAVLRRASSCPLIPLVFRSPRSSSSLIPLLISPTGYSSSVLHPRNRLFSTNSPVPETSDKYRTVSLHNFGEKVENEMATYSHGLPPLPSGFPFLLNLFASDSVYMKKRDGKETIVIVIDGSDPNIRAFVRTTSVEISTVMNANLDKDQIDIHEVTARDPEGVMGDYIEYIQTKGITPKTISLVYNLLGFNQMKT